MIRAFKNSSLRPRRGDPAPIVIVDTFGSHGAGNSFSLPPDIDGLLFPHPIVEEQANWPAAATKSWMTVNRIVRRIIGPEMKPGSFQHARSRI